MRMKIIAAALVATGVLAACDANKGPMEKAGESIDEAIDNANEPDTVGEALDEAVDNTADAMGEVADDIDGAVDEAGEAMEEAADPPK
jgi:predicted RNase H-like HicB family nuclease